jgi:UDP-N-acetyl-D-galactosamine dehydrogenase
MVGYQPEVILAGRRINDSMAHFVAGKTLKLMTEEGIVASGATANVLGVTFKENCPDTRNSQVFPLIEALKGFGLKVSAIDPWADAPLVFDETGVPLKNVDELEPAEVTLLAVPHQEFRDKGYAWIRSMTKTPGVFVDIQAVFRASVADDETFRHWSL